MTKAKFRTEGLLSLSAYARSRKERGLPGGSHEAVRKAIASGRLTGASFVHVGARKKINPEKADLEWASNTDPVAQRDPESAKGGAGDGLFPDASPPRPSRGPSPEESAEQARVRRATANAQALRVKYGAQRAKLQFEREAGNLVDADTVRRKSFELARGMRDSVLSIVEGAKADLASETDPHAVGEMLRDLVENALTQYAKAI